jgi:hypothetical protein
LKKVLHNILKGFDGVYLERSRKAQPDNHNDLNKFSRFILAFSALIIHNSSLISQTLIPTAETAFESQLPFNTEYIKSQKIKSITFDIIDKKDMQVAEDKGLLNYYEFNPSGLLTRFYYTSIIKIIQKEYHSEPVYRHRRLVSY